MRTLSLSRAAVAEGNLILVNAAHPYRAAPRRLVPVREGMQAQLQGRAAVLLNALMEEIRGWDGIVPVSAWRSRREQQAIWDDSERENGPAFTAQFVARPGCSEHETGLAIDLGEQRDEVDFLCPAFPETGLCAAFRARAARYGFVLRYPAGKEDVTGIANEPWHFRYVGAPHAQIMEERGLVLEEYLALLRAEYPAARPLEFSREGQHASVYSVPAAPGKDTVLSLAEDRPFCVSGDNMDGFLVTVWGARHG